MPVSTSVLRVLVAALVSCSFVAGCGGSSGAPRATSSLPSSSSSSSSESASAAPSTTPAPSSSAPYVAPTRCLLRVSEVESVLGGNWTRKDSGKGNCVYRSDRTAIFAAEPVPTPPAELQDALSDARVHNCDTPPQDVAGTGGGFVCTERRSDGDTVEGNLVTGGQFWLLVIVATGGGTYPAQSKAIAALMKVAAR